MTKPRQVLAGVAYMIQRRCTQRQLLMRPDEETNNAFLYCLLYALSCTSVVLVAVSTMSNHYHAVILDRLGELPKFMARFHQLFARSQNAKLGRWENFWSTEKASAVSLLTPQDIEDKVVYTLLNPVAANLVERADEWPGVNSWVAMQANAPLQAVRPAHFFSKKMPAALEGKLAVPEGRTHEEWIAKLRQRIDAQQAEAATERTASKRTVLGAAMIRAQLPTDTPARPEAHFQLSPRIACSSKWHRIEAISRDKAFQDAYRKAFAAWRDGEPAAFPPGTWAMRRVSEQPAARSRAGIAVRIA